MFAKVFGQIFDSSIAEDYNCRRMFMDLLVLADSTGAVDMTPEAISRRTNVPQPEVEKYINDLCQPDARSRSDLHEGKRLIPLDAKRDWGWLIVNYSHYRQIKDEEARRAYFRNAQRQYRKGKKVVKDKSLTKLNTNGQLLTPASASSYLLLLKSESVRERFRKWIEVRKSQGKKPKDWDSMFAEQCEFLKQFDEAGQIEAISASIRGNWQGLFAPNQKNGHSRPKEKAPCYPKMSESREPTQAEVENAKRIANEETAKFKAQFQ